ARPLSRLRGVTLLLLAGVAVQAARFQVVGDVDTMTRPMLGIQADGVRRFEYNPRVLEVAESIPRGTIYDRHGLPLATSRPDEIARFADTYRGLGLEVETDCAGAGRRCYPLGGLAFHVLGSATTRVNWAATNTSFEERDADARLRGYDDHARIEIVSG